MALLDAHTSLGTINTYYITNIDSLFYGRGDYDFSGIAHWMTCNTTTVRYMFVGKTDN